jgi:hypothetical protein
MLTPRKITIPSDPLEISSSSSSSSSSLIRKAPANEEAKGTASKRKRPNFGPSLVTNKNTPMVNHTPSNKPMAGFQDVSELRSTIFKLEHDLRKLRQEQTVRIAQIHEEKWEVENVNIKLAAENESLMARIQEERRAPLCLCCESNEVNIMFDSCCHVICCLACAVKLERCPMCRRDIKEPIVVYLR